MVVRNCNAIKSQLHEETFVIEKIATLGEEKYLVLVNEEHRRMVDYSVYQNFGLKEGEEVKTVHKKENCAGDQVRMILHPRYLLNKTYRFVVKGFTQEEISGFKLNFMVLGDDTGFEHKMRINEGDRDKFQSIVKCKVAGISPGKLNLFLIKS